MHRGFPRACPAIAAALWLLTAGAPLQAQEQAPVPAVDTTDRVQVVALYQNYYVPSNSATPGWSGNLATGDAGTLDENYRAATLQRINYYRAMCGLGSSIVFGASEDDECQQAALMMAAAGDISHTPPTSWPFYTAAAADACANSNIRLDSVGDEGPGAVDRFMADAESNNTYVGHRRWFLYPGEGEMGSGAVPPGAAYAGTAAIWINNLVVRPADAPAFTCWPCAGYVPADLVFDRWSFSYQNADFTQAVVTVTKNGAPMTVTPETPEFQSSATDLTIVGDNTLVWELPDNVVSLSSDESYAVQVANVLINGQPQTFNYHVTSIDAQPVTIDVLATVPVAHRTGAQEGKIQLTRSGDTSAPLTVNYTVGGTATPGERYTALSGQATFKAGRPHQGIPVLPATTPGLRGKRTVVITLQPGPGYVLDAVTSATVTIQN